MLTLLTRGCPVHNISLEHIYS